MAPFAIIDTQKQLNQLCAEVANEPIICVPLPCYPHLHAKKTALAMVYMYNIRTKNAFCAPVNHIEKLIDSTSIFDIIASASECWVPSVVIAQHLGLRSNNLRDIAFVEHILTNEKILDISNFAKIDLQKEWNTVNAYPVNSYFRLSELGRTAHRYTEYLLPIVNKSNQISPSALEFFHTMTLPVCFHIEQSDIRVDGKEFQRWYKPTGFKALYADNQLNPYTTTGRISSRFNRVNWSAMNKSDGSRKTVITNHQDSQGCLVLIDWESFHLRLIAEQMQFELPTEPVHQYLGKQYFQVDTLTPEQYDEGKKRTFLNMYSDDPPDKDIEFFNELRNFMLYLWDQMEESKRVLSPSGRPIMIKHIEDASPAKVLNYYTQLLETETAMRLIKGCLPYFVGKSRIIMYTYDSILIDYCFADGKEFLLDVFSTLQDGGKFPVRAYIGQNYHELTQVTETLNKGLSNRVLK